jgi:hypothetical protein
MENDPNVLDQGLNDGQKTIMILSNEKLSILVNLISRKESSLSINQMRTYKSLRKKIFSLSRSYLEISSNFKTEYEKIISNLKNLPEGSNSEDLVKQANELEEKMRIFQIENKNFEFKINFLPIDFKFFYEIIWNDSKMELTGKDSDNYYREVMVELDDLFTNLYNLCQTK